MAPLSGIEDSPVAPLWSKVGRFVYGHGETFYNFKGLRAYKEKFDPEWEPRYLAYPGRPRPAADPRRRVGADRGRIPEDLPEGVSDAVGRAGSSSASPLRDRSTTIRMFVISSIANRTPSRPMPLMRLPPYGMWSTRKIDVSLTITPPTSSAAHGRERLPQVARVDAGLQAVRRIAEQPQRLVEVAIGDDRHERRERLLAHHLHLGPRVGEHGRPDQPALAAAARDERARPRRSASRIHRSARSAASSEIIGPTSQSRSSGLPTFSALGLPRRTRARNGVGDRLVDVQPLQAEAHLPGVGERRHHACAGWRASRSGVGLDDRAGVVAELERDALEAGELAGSRAPTGGLPVNETLAGTGCRTSASPVVGPSPCTSSQDAVRQAGVGEASRPARRR